jgi:hypothetical protein
MTLKNKIAMICGVAGPVGSAVARKADVARHFRHMKPLVQLVESIWGFIRRLGPYLILEMVHVMYYAPNVSDHDIGAGKFGGMEPFVILHGHQLPTVLRADNGKDFRCDALVVAAASTPSTWTSDPLPPRISAATSSG